MQWNRKLCGLRRRKSHQAVTHSAQWGGLWSPRNRPLFVSNSEVSPLQKETPLRIKFTNSLCWAKWWPKGYQLLIPGILPNSQVVLKQHLPHSPPVQFSCSVLSDSLQPHDLPVHHQLPEFTQTHVHRVSDTIQPSHPLPSPSPPAPNPSQHQSLFQWVNSSHEVAKVLEF